MAKVECAKCAKRYKRSDHKSCPKCGSKKVQPQDPRVIESDYPKIIAEEPPQVEKKEKTESVARKVSKLDKPEMRTKHSAVVAIRSAKIVNGYGTLLQVLGAIVGAGCIIAGYLLTHHYGSKGYVIGGVAIGLLDFALFAVQGAVFRMIANYVIAQLDNSK